MRSRSLLIGGLLAASLCSLPAGSASADVAYIDGNEVWLSTVDGSQKLQLSTGQGDWRDVAVSEDGFVVGIRLEAGKIADLSTFTVWNPQGQQIKFGPLVGRPGMVLAAFPLNLQLTPGGGGIAYGFSGQYGFGFPVSYERGFNFLPSDTVVTPALGTGHVLNMRSPVLIGQRVVAAYTGGTIGVQDPGSPVSTNFTPWPGIDASFHGQIDAMDVTPDGTRVALNLWTSGGSGSGVSKLIVWPTPGLGQAPVPLPNPTIPGDVGDCIIPTVGDSWHPSFSLDGSRLAWSDAGGVKIAPSPAIVPTDASGACSLPGPVVTLSATGKNPSIGGISVAAILAARSGGGGTPPGGGGTNPPGGGGGGGGTQPAGPALGKTSGIKLAALAGKKGATLKVTLPAAGKATASLTVKPSAVGRKGKKAITIATGKATLKAAKAGNIKLKFNATGKSLRKKLRGKQATLTVKAAGATTTKTLKLS